IQGGIKVALQRGGAAPAGFVRAGTRYVVRRLEADWKETAPWGDGDAERACVGVAASAEGAAVRIRKSAVGSGVYTAGGGTGFRRGEPTRPPGTYDLCLNEATNDWTVMWVVD